MAVYDLNSMDSSERTLCTYVRGLAWNLLAWFQQHYRINDPDGNPVDINWFFATYFAHIVYPILRSSSQPGVQHEKGAQGCTYERLMSQIDSAFPPFTLCGQVIRYKLTSNVANDPRYTMRRDVTVLQHCVPVPPINSLSSIDIMEEGTSHADDRYAYGLQSNFRLCKSSLSLPRNCPQYGKKTPMLT